MDLGEVASATAISLLTQGFANAQAGAMLICLLPRLMQHANAAVHDCTLTRQYRGKKIATTLVACALRYDGPSFRMSATPDVIWFAMGMRNRLRKTILG